MGILRSLVQSVEIHPAKKGFDVSFVGDIAQMIVVATHPERKLEVGRYKSSVKVVAEARYPTSPKPEGLVIALSGRGIMRSMIRKVTGGVAA